MATRPVTVNDILDGLCVRICGALSDLTHRGCRSPHRRWWRRSAKASGRRSHLRGCQSRAGGGGDRVAQQFQRVLSADTGAPTRAMPEGRRSRFGPFLPVGRRLRSGVHQGLCLLPVHPSPGQLRPATATGATFRRLEHSNSYVLTPNGQRVTVLYTRISNRLLRPLLAADQPAAAPLPVRQTLKTSTTPWSTI